MTEQERRLISNLAPAETIEQIFLISQPQLRTTSKGDYYIAAFLSDRTGRLNGRMWSASEAIYNSLPSEGFVKVRGRTEMYQNSMQLVIDAIRPVEITEVQLDEFMPSTENDVTEMWNRVLKVLDTVKNPHLKNLIKAFLDDKELMQMFRIAPAAIVLHHAYIGGLLEHTLSLLELAQRILPHYPELDADLIVIGLFLHDIGKTSELDYNISFKYSDQGRLIGHIVKGSLLTEEKIRQLNESADKQFPRVLADCLLHIIVSHHGIREFGCPVLPSTPEAFAVHYMDNLDSKIALTLGEIKKDTTNTNWTNYVRSIEAPIFKIHNSTTQPEQ